MIIKLFYALLKLSLLHCLLNPNDLFVFTEDQVTGTDLVRSVCRIWIHFSSTEEFHFFQFS